jgi:hypothetical protein
MYKVVFLILSLISAAHAQLNFSLESDGSYSSNIFSNYNETPDYVSTLGAAVNQDWIGSASGYRLYYRGEYNSYKELPVLTWQNHQIGTSFYTDWNGQANRLNVGLSFSKRLHGDELQWYEQWQVLANAQVKWTLQPQLFAYTGLMLRWRTYTSLAPFSYRQGTAFARISRFFDTGTTVMAEFQVTGKNYVPNSSVSDVADLPLVVTHGDGSSIQWLGTFKLAQALTAKTGLNLEMLLRRNPQSEIRYLGNDNGVYYSDEELFDDVLSYHGEEIFTTLKQMLPWSAKLNVGAGVLFKRYDNRLAADIYGVPFPDQRLRTDQRRLVWLTLEKTIPIKTAWQPLALILSWTRLTNDSNDPYYQYTGSYWSLGLNFGL